MHGRHIALFPLPGRGRIHPFWGLSTELGRRGYRVTIVTDDVNAKIGIPAGIEPVVFQTCKPGALRGGDRPANDPSWWEAIATVAYPWLMHSAALAVRQLDEFYKRNRPDLIVYDYGAYAGRIFAKRLGSPAVQYFHDFIHHSGYHYGDCPQPMLDFSKLLDAFLWAYGIDEVDSLWHSERLNLCPFPRAFQFGADSLDSRRFCFVGPFLDRPFQPMWKNRSDGRRIVLVSAITGSTDASYFNRVIDALSGSEYHVILSVGEHFPLDRLSELPANFEIVTRASHLEILPHTALHLYSGGIGGTIEGFYFGVPLIAVPSLGTTCRIAERLAESGFALQMPLHALTSQMIREHVEIALTDQAFLDRVKLMQNVVRSYGGSAMAVDRIEEFLADCA